MLERILELANTFSEEAQNSALEKCAELNFDTSRGIVTLEESFINLNTSRLLLIDAIENAKLIQLPIPLQKSILTVVEKISTSLTNLISGSDEVVNLVNHIEALNVAIWQHGLHNLSEEVVGYQAKLKQVKTLELEANSLIKELKTGLRIKTNLETILHDAESKRAALADILSTSEQKGVSISERLSSSSESEQLVTAKLNAVAQNEKTSSEHLANIKAKNEEVMALTTGIKDFHAEIAQHKKKITDTEKNAEAVVNKNNEETKQLIETLEKLENKIKDQLHKATGYSLFHSFQTRKNTLAKAKLCWVGAIAFLVIATVGLSYWLSQHASFDTAFYLKLSMSIPLIYAITFCTKQYSHERKLEEEYAFKSNISVSLLPYKNLVGDMIDNEKTGELQKYSSFIIESINKVFTSPTGLVFSRKDKKELGSEELKDLISQLSPLLKLLKG